MKENLETETNKIENKKANSNLRKAKKAKKDEFYTSLSEIEKEVKNYNKHFKDKIVYCNCDDPEWSNFFKYFNNNFDFLVLKKVITTHYEEGKQSYKLELNKKGEVVKTDLKGDGDFRSEECIEILKEADIVITNPPFSLFREYVSQLVEYDKKFLVLGNNNALTYKEIFRLVKDNKLWMGYSVNKTMEFQLSDGYERWDRTDEDGKKYGKVPSISWLTNMEHKKRNEEIILFKKYKNNETEYPNYENYDAINIDITKHIPIDYNGNMGVPITFMDKYNPEQFEIVALGVTGSIKFSTNKKMEILKDNKETGKFTHNGKGTLYRKYNKEIKKDKEKGAAFKDCENGELYSSIYARIIIKNKNPKKL